MYTNGRFKLIETTEIVILTKTVRRPVGFCQSTAKITKKVQMAKSRRILDLKIREITGIGTNNWDVETYRSNRKMISSCELIFGGFLTFETTAHGAMVF